MIYRVEFKFFETLLAIFLLPRILFQLGSAETIGSEIKLPKINYSTNHIICFSYLDCDPDLGYCDSELHECVDWCPDIFYHWNGVECIFCSPNDEWDEDGKSCEIQYSDFEEYLQSVHGWVFWLAVSFSAVVALGITIHVIFWCARRYRRLRDVMNRQGQFSNATVESQSGRTNSGTFPSGHENDNDKPPPYWSVVVTDPPPKYIDENFATSQEATQDLTTCISKKDQNTNSTESV